MEEKPDFLMKISKFIVDKRNLFFFVFILLITFSVFSMKWTVVETDLTAYLDEETDTRIGLTLMEEEFSTFGTAQVMLSNIDYESAFEISEIISEIKGVKAVSFDNNEDYYINSSALFSVMFDGEDNDELPVKAMAEIRELIDGYDTAIDTTVGISASEGLAAEMQVITSYLIVIIIIVLVFTSKSYAEIPILLLTFGTAALINMGTNYLFGNISFISDSVSIVLQLALAIDYAIILCHRYAEEREEYASREACIIALSKAIPEISSSSLTTISGLLALSFMNYQIGADLSKVLIKSIIISLFCVFTLMPGLLVISNKLIDKTQHKNFVPSIKIIGKFSIATRYLVIPLFIVATFYAFSYSNQTEYLFSVNEVRAKNFSESQIQSDRIKENFGSTNPLALIVPSGDYEKEGLLIKKLEAYEEVDSVMGFANTEAMDNYMLTDYLIAREFSELLDIDYEQAQLLYSSFAIDDENYAKLINRSDQYALPLIDVILFLDDMRVDGYFQLEDDLESDLISISNDIRDGQKQLESDNYTRLLVSLNLPEESAETFAFLETIEKVSLGFYDEVYLVGNPTSNADLSSTFTNDNLIISILSALFVVIVLLFTFGSVGISVILIVIIQSAIFMNFAFPYLQGKGLYFIGYLVVSSIQMGANVDYAIVITNRYMELRKNLDNKLAIITALDESFATVITSGSILASAGIVIQNITTDGTIAAIGECIGRGTIISMVLVMLVLPQILYVGTTIIDKTSFSMKFNKKIVTEQGKLKTNGYVKGYVSGYVDAKVVGTITGEVSAKIENIEILEE